MKVGRGRLKTCRRKEGLRSAPVASARPGAASRIQNYSADAGAGSRIVTNLAESPGWRAALLGTVAAGSLWLYSARSARADPDPCTISGTSPNQTALCQGNQSQGIAGSATFPATGDFDSDDVETLNVNDLTTDIMPAVGVDGIFFHRDAGNIVINSDTTDGPNGAKQIIVTSPGAISGIDLEAPGAITITHRGAIVATNTSTGLYGSYGIFARSAGGEIEITNYGEITATSAELTPSTGIFIRSDAPGAVGGITVTNAATISAEIGMTVGNATQSGTVGDVFVVNTGNITSTASLPSVAINASSGGRDTPSGNVTVYNYGVLSNSGIFASASSDNASGDVVIVNRNTITGGNISAHSSVLASLAGSGVAGSTTIVNNGDIEGGGIEASSTGVNGGGAVRVENTANVTASFTLTGIIAFSEAGFFPGSGNTVTVVTNGDITARYGIFARSFGPDGNGDIDVIVLGGTVTGTGSPYGLGTGIQLSLGAQNSIVNYGTVSGRDYAILANTGDDAVSNFGIVTGDVHLGAGANAFNNFGPGTFNSGAYAFSAPATYSAIAARSRRAGWERCRRRC